MAEPAERLRVVAEALAAAYVEHCRPRAILLVGSAATGGVDGFSDVDMILYYDAVPERRELAAARAQVGAEQVMGTDWPGEGYSERYWVDAIHCQLGHALIEAWEGEIARVVDELDLDSRLLKQLGGLFEGRGLHGADLIERWRERAAYTERLQRATIERHWQFFPWWYYEEKLARRDATIWRFDVLVQSAYNLVGVLAALNRIYYSTFELKRVRAFLERFELAPPRLADRLESMFVGDARVATAGLEQLVAETRGLVLERFPDLALRLEWAGNATPPGSREVPWA
jgi:hypothetical protein